MSSSAEKRANIDRCMYTWSSTCFLYTYARIFMYMFVYKTHDHVYMYVFMYICSYSEIAVVTYCILTNLFNCKVNFANNRNECLEEKVKEEAYH